MGLIKRINGDELKKEFEEWGRDYYSYEACDAMVEFYDSLGDDYELDIVAMCGEFTEWETNSINDLLSLLDDYRSLVDWDGILNLILDELSNPNVRYTAYEWLKITQYDDEEDFISTQLDQEEWDNFTDEDGNLIDSFFDYKFSMKDPSIFYLENIDYNNFVELIEEGIIDIDEDALLEVIIEGLEDGATIYELTNSILVVGY